MAGDSELVEVAFVGDEPQALMLQALLKEHGIPSLKQQVTPSGPTLGYGLLNPGGGSQRLMVHADRADRARALVEATLAEGEFDVPETVNSEYLADSEGRKPRGYGLIGGYARAYFWSFAAMALAFAVFMLLRAL
ncbi:MAG TPA: DUF2007 domain-containing protein [Solirubrobacterales bacterium]|nr:DUF2007 domain-containing protein [Solirubrobacterales bacterium]